MNYLKERKLHLLIKDLQQPVLGICLGMQLMCAFSEENNTDCLGIFGERVRYFGSLDADKISDDSKKVPQIGWNNIYELKSGLFKDIPESSFCYFVHGYYADSGPHTIAKTQYRVSYSSALHKRNFYGVQFHPEKSAAVGERLLVNFLSI